MIRPCTPGDFDAIWTIIQDGAARYRGVLAPDCLHDPYMSREELAAEIASGVQFVGYIDADSLQGVMGAQSVQDVTLIRHAYVRSAGQGRGVGSALLAYLLGSTGAPVLVGTWAAATWAIRFYQRHGFRLVSPETKVALLRRYWTVSERQIETSVVLADPKWFERNSPSFPSQTDSPNAT